MNTNQTTEKDLLLKQPIPDEQTSTTTQPDPEGLQGEGDEATEADRAPSDGAAGQRDESTGTLVTAGSLKENDMEIPGGVAPSPEEGQGKSDLITPDPAPQLGLEKKDVSGITESDAVVLAADNGKEQQVMSEVPGSSEDNRQRVDVMEEYQKSSNDVGITSEKADAESKTSQTTGDIAATVEGGVPQLSPLDPGEGGTKSQGEGGVPKEGEGKGSEKKKEDVKKTKQKDGKKSKKGRDSEYMGRTLSQALAGLDTPEERIAALCKKYAELLGEHKGLQREHKTHQKQLVLLQRDRDHLQSEHGRAILAKSKLESLCRELQRHNKTIKEESIQRSKEEDEKRKEVSNKFQQTINEITNQMQDNHTRNIRLKEENLELASKLKKLVEQYERREEHIEKVFKHKELETQLSDAKLQQSNLALQEEQERFKRERALLLNEAAEAQTKCELLMKQETQLKAQLAVYTEKFEEFQSTLTKSNEIFQTFKQEMDQMTKKIKKLEKETNMWRVRWENSNKSLLNMAEERTLREKELASLKNKMVKLENLCRALQAERNALLGKARSKEGALSSPTKSKKQGIESTCSKADVPAITDGNVPVTSPKQSEPMSTVDDKTLVNGDCDHGGCDHGGTAKPGGVGGSQGQGVRENGGTGVVGGGEIPQPETGGKVEAQESTVEEVTEVKLQPSVDGNDTGQSGSSQVVTEDGGGHPGESNASVPEGSSSEGGGEDVAGMEVPGGGGESSAKDGSDPSPGKESSIAGECWGTDSTSTAAVVSDNTKDLEDTGT